MNKDTNWSFDANGSPIEIKNSDFLSDPEKMRDFKKLSKTEFLAFYSYVTEEEYDNTVERDEKRGVRVSNILEKTTNKFIFDEKEMTFFQKNKLNGWCIVLGTTGDCSGEENVGKFTEFQVSDGTIGNRSSSSDHYFLEDAMKECIRFNEEMSE